MYQMTLLVVLVVRISLTLNVFKEQQQSSFVTSFLTITPAITNHNLALLNILPLSLWFELQYILFLITCLQDPLDTINFSRYVKFATSSTRANTFTNSSTILQDLQWWKFFISIVLLDLGIHFHLNWLIYPYPIQFSSLIIKLFLELFSEIFHSRQHWLIAFSVLLLPAFSILIRCV